MKLNLWESFMRISFTLIIFVKTGIGECSTIR